MSQNQVPVPLWTSSLQQHEYEPYHKDRETLEIFRQLEWTAVKAFPGQGNLFPQGILDEVNGLAP
jgi:hypothetical protein